MEAHKTRVCCCRLWMAKFCVECSSHVRSAIYSNLCDSTCEQHSFASRRRLPLQNFSCELTKRIAVLALMVSAIKYSKLRRVESCKIRLK